MSRLWPFLVLATAGCSEGPRSFNQATFESGAIKTPPVIDWPLTYWADVKPIVDSRCVTCHTGGGSGPGDYRTYEEVKAHAASLKIQVTERRMPPFIGLSECADYANDWSLTEEQRGILTTWVDQGTPEGDAAAPGAALDVVQAKISRVDHELKMPEAYTPKEHADDYRCFILDWPETRPVYVTGFGVVPGHVDEVHHVLAFSIPGDHVAEIMALDAAEEGPGYTCFGGPGVERSRVELVGAWVPGVGSGDLPPDTGILVQPGSKIVMQMHYNTTGAYSELHGSAHPDQSTIEVKVDATVKKPVTTMPVVNPAWVLNPQSMLIPKGEESVIHTYAFDPTILSNGLPIQIHRATLHQHVLGVRTKLAVKKWDGKEQCLVDIPRWDFHWQSNYEFAEPVRVLPGEQLQIGCEWDNSGDGSQDVTWGEGTNDEMCLGGILVSY